MKYNCEVIRDLLPLCEDHVASASSQVIVNEHLSECTECRGIKERMETAPSQPIALDKERTETLNYVKLAKRVKKRRTVMTTSFLFVLLLVIYFSYAYATGYRFEAYQSAQSSSWIDESSILLGDVESYPYHVYLYENEDKYRTIVTNYSFPFWKLGDSFWANKTDDPLKLVGWCSVQLGNNAITVVPIQNFDEDVAYIEMGNYENRIRKEVSLGDVIIFSWAERLRWNDLNAVAYSKEGDPLYQLGYEIKNSTIQVDELRWLPINESER